jgi:hypothetical protein
MMNEIDNRTQTVRQIIEGKAPAALLLEGATRAPMTAMAMRRVLA